MSQAGAPGRFDAINISALYATNALKFSSH